MDSSCYIDQNEYESRYNKYENCLRFLGDNPQRCERDRIYAQAYLDKQRTLCEIQKVNQSVNSGNENVNSSGIFNNVNYKRNYFNF